MNIENIQWEAIITRSNYMAEGGRKSVAGFAVISVKETSSVNS
jgi:hypothetical protein